MAQFGAQKNPPWVRPATGAPGLNVPSLAQPQVAVGNPLLSQPGMTGPQYSLTSAQNTLQQQQYTAQQLALSTQLAQQTAIQAAGQGPAILPQPGIAIPTTLATTQVATVSYPTPRAAQQQATQSKQRVFTGTITKLHDNFGFVDEDVFFQTSCVKGVLPKVGDRVLVEATYNANMPFKWNATRIQVLPNQNQPQMPHHMSASMQSQAQAHMAQLQAQSIMKPNLAPPSIPPSITPTVMSQPPPLMGQQPQPTGVRQAIQNNRRPEINVYRDRERDRERDRDRRERRERRSPRKRSRSPSRRSRSPATRQRSPQRRRPTRIVPRYMVQIPKISLDQRDANVISLRSRYQNLYVPSDFFNAHFAWIDAFPMHRPFQLGNLCNFHVMHKEVVSVEPNTSVSEPNDADHLYSAKVMLMASPTLDDLYHKSCALAEDDSEQRESFQHPTRLLNFLVGLKGKSEPMAIGGAWSPSLDGPNPEEDPRVLIKTAIRTTKTLTGIDLTSCTQWYRFAEIRYHRPEETHKGRLVPARVETVVIFLPDVWRCHPTHLEWDSLRAAYKKQLTDKIAEESREDTQEEEEEGGEADMEKKEPSHYSEIDPKVLKAPELRRELESRNLSSKGLKSQLIARLTKALKSEQEKEEQEKEEAQNKAAEEQQKQSEEENKMETNETEEEKKKEEEEKKRREEREKAQRERRYSLPESPAVLVHPSPTAKNGKFDCSVMSLSVLLDYRPEDNKEHSFEVSLFAELFNEMLMRDFGFRIYRALASAPDRKEEDKKDEKKDKTHKESSKDEKKDKERSNSQEPNAKRRRSVEKEDKDDKKDEKKDDKKEDENEEEKEKGEKSESKKDEVQDEDEEERQDEDEDEDDKDHKDKDRKKDKDKDKDKKREKLKFCTGDPELLLAFVYFDQNHTGYLLDKDVEEILHTIGLHLSRAQIRKLVQKMVTRDTLNYRKITDKQKVREGKEKEGDSKAEAEEKKDVPDEAKLAAGNSQYLRWLGKDSSAGKMPRKGSTEEASSGMVMYKGALVDIESVMQRLEKSEKIRTTVEGRLREIQDEMDELKSSFTSSEQNSQKVAVELQDLKKRLREQKKFTDSAEKDAKKYQEALSKSRDALSSVLTDVTSALALKAEIKTEPVENGGV